MARLCQYQQAWGEVEALVCSRVVWTRRRNHEGTRITEVAEWGRFQHAPVAPGFPWHLRRNKADIVVLHLPNPTAEIAWLLSRPHGDLVIRYHSDVVRQAKAMRFYGPIQQRLLNHASVILPTSAEYMDTSPILQPHRSRCHVVPLGIDTRPFQVEDKARVAALRAHYGARFVLFAGKHRYYKGLDSLIEAATQIDAPVVIAGDGPERERLMALAARQDVTVHFPGHLSHTDLVAHLHASTVVTLPSIARSEAFGIAILEAHAAGRPVVATQLGTGVEFANQDGETGINVPARDPGALARAINTLLASPETCLAMGARARERVLRDFDAERLAYVEWQTYQGSAS